MFVLAFLIALIIYCLALFRVRVCACQCLCSLGVTSSVQLATGRHQNEWLRQRTWARQFVRMRKPGKSWHKTKML